jgi:hypothetical protein
MCGCSRRCGNLTIAVMKASGVSPRWMRSTSRGCVWGTSGRAAGRRWYWCTDSSATAGRPGQANWKLCRTSSRSRLGTRRAPAAPPILPVVPLVGLRRLPFRIRRRFGVGPTAFDRPVIRCGVGPRGSSRCSAGTRPFLRRWSWPVPTPGEPDPWTPRGACPRPRATARSNGSSVNGQDR